MGVTNSALCNNLSNFFSFPEKKSFLQEKKSACGSRNSKTLKKKCCHPSPFLYPRQRQATTTIPAGIKRVKDLTELLRRTKGHAQRTIAFFLGSFFKKKSRSACADRDFSKPNKGRHGFPRHPKLYQCYFICIIFFVAEAVAVSNV